MEYKHPKLGTLDVILGHCPDILGAFLFISSTTFSSYFELNKCEYVGIPTRLQRRPDEQASHTSENSYPYMSAQLGSSKDRLAAMSPNLYNCLLYSAQ